MTTIKDLLRDFAKEVAELERSEPVEGDQTITEALDQLIDEYIETIKERIVG